MTEQQKLEITVGMRVMVKVAAREIPATVVEVGGDWFLVRSDGTGREFRTRRVVDILDRPETDESGIAEAAAEVAAEEDATAELRRREEEGTDADEADETAEADGEGDTKAEEQLHKAFPHHNIVGIDCRPLITQHGSLHCCTMQFPKGTM